MWIKSMSERLKAQRAKEFRRAPADPLTSRRWHDRTEFYQSNALEAAVMKRRRRAEKLNSSAFVSSMLNKAHGFTASQRPKRFDPFYVAK